MVIAVYLFPVSPLRDGGLPQPSQVILTGRVLRPLTEMGCHYEGANRRLISISIPPSVSLEAVGSYLADTGLQWEYANPTFEGLFPEVR